jgi:hypothetical protein
MRLASAALKFLNQSSLAQDKTVYAHVLLFKFYHVWHVHDASWLNGISFEPEPNV